MIPLKTCSFLMIFIENNLSSLVVVTRFIGPPLMTNGGLINNNSLVTALLPAMLHQDVDQDNLAIEQDWGGIVDSDEDDHSFC